MAEAEPKLAESAGGDEAAITATELVPTKDTAAPTDEVFVDSPSELPEIVSLLPH